MKRAIGPVLALVVFLLAGAAMIVTIALLWNSLDHKGPVGWGDLAWLACGAALYLFGHALRALRLTIMINDPRVGLRETFAAHGVAAGASLLVPFKLGEVFRIAEVTRLSGSLARGTLIVWSERVLDLLVITAAMLTALIFRPGLFPSAASGVLLTGAVIVGTLVLFYVLPENLESVKLFIIRRYRGGWSLGAVRAVDGVQRVLESAPSSLRRRWSTLLSLTMLIWCVEIAGLGLLLPSESGVLAATLVATAFFFSQVFPSSMGPLGAILARVLPGSATTSSALALYPGVYYLVFLVVVFGLYIWWMPTRLAHGVSRVRESWRPSIPSWAREPAPMEEAS